MASALPALDDTRVRKLISSFLLAAGPQGAAPTEMQEQLESLLRDYPKWHAAIGTALGQMEKAGHLLPPAMIEPRFRLSEQGRKATLHWLHLPPEWSQPIAWQAMLDLYLPCMALHLAPPLAMDDPAAIDAMLQAAVLVRHYHLPTEGSPTLTRVRGMLVARQFEKMLGLNPGEARLKSPPAGRAATLLLCPLLGLRTSRSSPQKLTLQLVTHVLGVDSLDDVKSKVLHLYLTRSEGLRPRASRAARAVAQVEEPAPTAVAPADFIGPPEPPPPLPKPPTGPIMLPAAGGLPDAGDAGDRSLRQFAQTVLAAARGTSAGGSPRRMYISLIWRRVQAQNVLPGVEEAHFKRLLTMANNRGMIELARATPGEAHDAAELEASRTRYLGSEFHYLLLGVPQEVA